MRATPKPDDDFYFSLMRRKIARFVLFDAGITSDARVDEEIVVEVVIGRRDLSNDALLGKGTELVVDTGDEGHAPSCVELDDRSGSDCLLFMVNRDAERFILGAEEACPPRPAPPTCPSDR